MNIQISKNRVHIVLIVFILLTIIGDVGNVAFWWINPASQISLIGGTINDVATPGGFLFDAVGAANALAIGSALLMAIAIVYVAALFGLLKNLKSAPLLVIAVSVVNRVFALVIFNINSAYAFWAAWTVILISLSYLEHRSLATRTAPPAPPQP